MVALLSVIPFALLLNVVSKCCLFTALLLMCDNIKSWHLTERLADTAHLIQPPQIYMSQTSAAVVHIEQNMYKEIQSTWAAVS